MLELTTARNPANQREGQIFALYKSTFPAVAKFVSKRGGTFEQAKDIFQDALVIWYEKAEMVCEDTGHGIQQNAGKAEKAYLFGIAKNLWYRNFAKEARIIPLDPHLQDKVEEQPDEPLSTNKLLNLLESSGKKCLDLLKSFYYDKLSMAEVAAGFGFRSVHSASVQKYKCLEKVRETVKEKSLCYEDFLE